jgi:DNA helicase IV
VASDPELEGEQRFLDRAHERLEAMRSDANRMLESVLDLGRGGTFQSRTERDIVVRTSLARLAQLDIGDQALCFGRIDRVPDEDGRPGETFHIGRLAVSGEDLEPLVVDWRAPVAEPFYRATGVDPQGLARRRHLAVRSRIVTGLEDEYFNRPLRPGELGADGDGPARAVPGPGGGAEGGQLVRDGLVLGGPGALLAALGQTRTGRMGDIVATIQREQDEIVRSPLAGVLMVQGAPGTGKTAVALHRAAYLLYTYRFPLERQGVLVLGPNPLFLRYIEQVLPSLGETGATLSTVSGLVPEVKVSGTDAPEVARLKGEERMTRVLARAVRTRQRALRDDLSVPFGPVVLRMSVAESADIVTAARRRSGPHNARRRYVERRVLGLLADRYLARIGASSALSAAPAAEGGSIGLDGILDGLAAAGLGASSGPADGGPDDDPAGEDALDPAEIRRRLRRTPEVSVALDRMWPRLAPHELLHDLFGARPLLTAATRGILSPDEANLLYRARSATLESVPWTPADAALVDEVRGMLGPRAARPRRSRPEATEQARARSEAGFWPAGLDPSPLPSPVSAEPEEIRSFGHIVVDEVQDLSPLQLRMLARRSLSGSMTVVGDIAQATGPWAPDGWADIVAHLPDRSRRLVELTVSYRTPAEVVELATGVLEQAAPGVAPPQPVRRSGHLPLVASAPPGGLAERVAEVAGEQLAAVGAGRCAVLAPASLVGAVFAALDARGVPAVDPRDARGAGLAAPLVVLPVGEAHGLEFDSVIVVEPALIAADAPTPAPGPGPRVPGPPAPTRRGLRTLYVALTRPTQRLVLVHALPLPDQLGREDTYQRI